MNDMSSILGDLMGFKPDDDEDYQPNRAQRRAAEQSRRRASRRATRRHARVVKASERAVAATERKFGRPMTEQERAEFDRRVRKSTTRAAAEEADRG